MDPFEQAWNSTETASADPFEAAWNSYDTPTKPTLVNSQSATRRPTWGESATFVGKALAEGAGKTLDLVSALNPFSIGSDRFLNFKDRPAETFMTDLFGRPEDTGITGTVPDIAKAAVESSTFPFGGPVANALAGAGAEIGHKVAPESRVAPFIGALFGSGTAAAGEGLASWGLNAGKAFERSSVGARVGDYLKSLRNRGVVDDTELNQMGTRLSEAINEIGDTEGFGLLRDPQRLAQKNQDILSSLGQKIGTTIDEADAAGAQAMPNFGPGSATDRLIANAKAEKRDLKEALSEFKARFFDPNDGWDGTVQGLNAWKSSVGNLGFTGTAKGSLPAAVGRKLQRALYQDMSNAVNGAVTKSGVVDAGKWSALMRQYSNHAELLPVLNPNVARSLNVTWDKIARGMLRTSGGTLTTPTIIGAALSTTTMGPLAGLMAGGALSLLSSPTGQGLMGNLLKTSGRLGVQSFQGSAASLFPGLVNAIENQPQADMAIPQDKTPMTEQTKEDVAWNEIKSDPYYHALALTESDMNPNAQNPKSTAKGLFQFIDSTAKAVGLKNPFDVAESLSAVKQLTGEHNAKFGADPATLYSAHYLGGTLLKKLQDGKPLTTREQKLVDSLLNKALPRFMKNYEMVSA